MPPIESLDMECRYGGRVLRVTLCLNTEQDHEKLLKNLRRVARGPRLDAVVIQIEGYTGEDGVAVWREVQGVSAKLAADPRSQVTGSQLVDSESPSGERGAPGHVVLGVRDRDAQDLLWEYQRRRRAADPEFSRDLEAELRDAGYDPAVPSVQGGEASR